MAVASAYKYLPAQLADGLNNLNITVRRPVQGRMEGQHRSPNFGSSVEFAEYREYAPGDPTHLIDWFVYARSDRYVVRRFHEETNLRATILLDISASLRFREQGQMTKMDYALFLTAGLMYLIVRQRDSVALMTFDDQIRQVFEPVGAFEGLRPLLLRLEQLQAAKRGNIEAAIHQAADLIKGKSLVVIVSDLLQPPEALLRGIKHLNHDGHNIKVLHVMDAAERLLSYEGVMEFQELETSECMVVEIDEIRQAYRAAVDRFLNRLRLECAECLADYHLLDTRTPVVEALQQVAGAR